MDLTVRIVYLKKYKIITGSVDICIIKYKLTENKGNNLY